MKSGQEAQDIHMNRRPKSSWLKVKDLYIHRKWFKRGIIVASNEEEPASLKENDHNIDISQARSLDFTLNPIPNIYPLTSSILEGLEVNEGENSSEEDIYSSSPVSSSSEEEMALHSSYMHTQFLLQKMIDYANVNQNDCTLVTSDKIIFSNPQKKDEAFLPLVLNSSQNEKQGLYLYPWLTNELDALPESRQEDESSKEELLLIDRGLSALNFSAFKGVHQFVTAGCMFGTALQAYDKKKARFALIQHKIPFEPGDKITRLSVDEQLHPYEQAQFASLRQTAELIELLTPADQPRKLIYHLPDFDYILYGIKLFVQDRIAHEVAHNVLQRFFDAVVKRAAEHRKIINKICNKNQIQVEIQSPFTNLFGEISNYETIEEILQVLGLSAETQASDSSSHKSSSISRKPEHPKKIEAELVARILKLLVEKNHNSRHQQIWSDFIAVSKGKHKINSLESLFKVANAVMIGLGAYGKQPYETCSLLPSNEKPICVKYAQYEKLLLKTSNSNYPPVVAFSLLESVIGYSPLAPKGNTFYFSPQERELRELEEKLLPTAMGNLGLFAMGQKSTKLKTLFQDSEYQEIFTQQACSPSARRTSL